MSGVQSVPEVSAAAQLALALEVLEELLVSVVVLAQPQTLPDERQRFDWSDYSEREVLARVPTLFVLVCWSGFFVVVFLLASEHQPRLT